MVVEWGMSDILGPLKYSENEEDVFLGRSVTQRTSMSDETAKLIDSEIRKLIDQAENHAKKILKKKFNVILDDNIHIFNPTRCYFVYSG